ncbi:hypothetical protein HDU98_001184 [Podochytrium sp. JEL0797]|nr:hypothetical protein HDU98_001184 [Podochytrium sp. JEL0797]
MFLQRLAVRRASSMSSAHTSTLFVRRQLDAHTLGSDAAALGFVATQGSELRLASTDVSRLVSAAAGARKAALVETLFASSGATGLPSSALGVVLEARAAAADVAGVAALLCDSSNNNNNNNVVDINFALSHAALCLARAAKFEEAEQLLNALVARLCPEQKKSKDEIKAFLDHQKQAKDAEKALRKREEEERMILAADNNSTATPVAASKTVKENTTTNTQDLDPSERLLATLIPLSKQKPIWRRHPPLPKDASPSLIKKRTRPQPPPHTALLLRTYTDLLQAYTTTTTPATKPAVLRLLETITTLAPRTKLLPNNTLFSIAMRPFERTGDFLACIRLREQAISLGLAPSLVLSQHILAACTAAGNLEAGKREIQHVRETVAPEGAAPTPALLHAMMRVYALDSTGASAPDAWGCMRTVVQGIKASPAFVEDPIKAMEGVYTYARELALATPLESGTELSVWNAWWDGIGKFTDLTRYACGSVGFASAGDIARLRVFVEALDRSVEDPRDRVEVYTKVIKGLVGAGKVLEAAEVFETAVSGKGVVLDRRAVDLLVKGLAGSEVEEKEVFVVGLVERMQRDGMEGRSGVLRVVREAFGEGSEVVKRYEALVV